MKSQLSIGFAALLISAAPACSQESKVSLDVPYVPTPQPVVDAMIDMVDLKDGDVVWDLGCGDGRMVITAAKRKDIRGVGVDLNPQRIKESKENAKKAGVEDEVNFRVANLFETDFSDATVLTMYLLQSVNLKLRPVILRDLQPGARIVSNSFTMGEWTPDESRQTDEQIISRNLYHWVVPANISGEWSWEMAGNTEELDIDQKFQFFSGTATVDGKEHEFQSGKVNGKEVAFVIKVPGREELRYQAALEGDILTGTINGEPWKATRKAGTKVPLEPVATTARKK